MPAAPREHGGGPAGAQDYRLLHHGPPHPVLRRAVQPHGEWRPVPSRIPSHPTPEKPARPRQPPRHTNALDSMAGRIDAIIIYRGTMLPGAYTIITPDGYVHLVAVFTMKQGIDKNIYFRST